MKVFKAPESTANAEGFNKTFLAGSIEMGTAELWQDRAIKIFEEDEKAKHPASIRNYNIFNPRRDDWDSSWKQTFDDPQFFQQVTWELHNLKKANNILFYFDPSTKSPITLMELGYVAGMNKRNGVVVVCPDGFWRKGNVQVICNLHSIPIMETLEEAINHLVSY